MPSRFRAAVAAIVVLFVTSGTAAAAPSRPPNVIVILTDDQGYADLGCYGSFQIKTPRIDRMAAEGMRFTDFYAPAPVCTPTRAGLLTGCHPQRVSLGHIPKEKPNGDDAHVLYSLSRHGLHPDEVTIPDVSVRLKAEQPVRKVTLEPQGIEIPSRSGKGEVSFTIDRVSA